MKSVSSLIGSKLMVEVAKEMVEEPQAEWTPCFAEEDSLEPSIRDDMLRGFSLGFTGGSLACGISAPFIVATAKADYGIYEDPQKGERMPERQLRQRMKLIGLATLGAPGLAVGTLLGGVCAVGGAVVGSVKKLVYKMAQA